MGTAGLNLIIGLITGSAITSLIWGVLVNIRKNRDKKDVEERNQVIKSIAELWADIDTLVTSYRSGLVKESGFKSTLASKLESINRLFKPNMHILDIYYVKYVESFYNEFSRIVHGSVSVAQFQETPVLEPSDVTSSDTAEDAFAESVDVLSGAESVPEFEFAVSEPEPQIPVEDKLEQEIAALKMVEPKIEDSFAVSEPVEPESQVIPEVEESVEVFEDGEDGFNIEYSDEQANDELLQNNSEIPSVLEEEIVESVGSDYQAPEPIEEVKEEIPEGEEEFTMETIMDLDMSRLPRLSPIPENMIEVPPKITLDPPAFVRPGASQPEPEELEPQAVEIAEQADTPCEAEIAESSMDFESAKETMQFEIAAEDAGISEQHEEVILENPQENESKLNFEENVVEDEPAVFELDDSIQFDNQSATHEKDISITGDDVADKIDAFFFGSDR